MKIINTIDKISDIYSNGSFCLEKWSEYINKVHPSLEDLCKNDMNEAILTGLVTFEKDYLPLLDKVQTNDDLRNEVVDSFKIITNNLNEKIIKKFGKELDVEIILYLGLGNGAGWVVTIDNKTYCLLGIEKIMELNWCDINSMYGLIYHELGHVYQNQYGILDREFDNSKNQFLWQLFTEGIAMYFEQTLIGDYNYYHQDKNGWKDWCDINLNQIKLDFYNDLDVLSYENQRYFGDWVFYKEHNDVGYYLGTRFVQFICEKYKFDDILFFNIETVDKLYLDFLGIKDFDRIIDSYNINYDNIKIIDSSKPNDFRFNIILDNKYVVRINNKDVITEERLAEIDRLISRYNNIGVYVPHYIRNNYGRYSLETDSSICYVSEYADYPLASEIHIDHEQLLEETVLHLGILAKSYSHYDLSKIKSMWSIIDLAPLDVNIDEKQENINLLVEGLKKVGKVTVAKKVIDFNNINRNKILKVFNDLPRCVYQGDLNDSNILIKDNHFYGLIDFNMSGTEVNINCFLSETNRSLEEEDLEKYTAKELLDEMINYQNKYLSIIFNNYQLNDIEKQVFENYRNLILISQYPNVCCFVNGINNKYKEKVLELIELIINR